MLLLILKNTRTQKGRKKDVVFLTKVDINRYVCAVVKKGINKRADYIDIVLLKPMSQWDITDIFSYEFFI